MKSTRAYAILVIYMCPLKEQVIRLGQIRPDGYKELPLVTLGSDITAERELLLKYPTGWSAKQAVEYLLGTVVD